MGAAIVPMITAAPGDVSSAARSLLPNGFVLTDDDFVVAYGSGTLRDLPRIPRIVTLFDSGLTP